MIITRTPFRISFFGGGTDYPAWFEEYGGAVLSTTIDKYCHVTVRPFPPFFEHKSRIAYSKIELVKSKEEIEHPVVREALKFFNIDYGVEIHNFNDLPARAGMGSSSSFTVGLLHALHALKGEKPSKEKLAHGAIHVEQNLVKDHVGCQDQTAAAFGGLNKITFGGPEKIKVEKITLEPEKLEALQNHLMLFFTGISRNSSEIAAHQIKNIPNKIKELHRMREMVDESITILRGGDINDFGKLLDEAWRLKRDLSSQIANPFINDIYVAGRRAGALGGKLLGAGGGGFMLFFVKPKDQEKVKEALKNILYIPFQFEHHGSKVIFEEKETPFA